ncbi:MAG: nucleotidyltransferase domain-containing protein [Terriglobales bacterium]
MVPEKEIDEFVARIRQAAGENLQSVILYGSAVTGEFHDKFSNVNLLCVVRDASYATLSAIAPAVEWWTRHKRHVPLVLTGEELQRSADVFSIEFLDMQLRHRVLFGVDGLAGLTIPMHFHRAQVEYELREKTILLRERLLVAGTNRKQLWELMMSSLATFATLFRHSLIALGETPPDSKRETVLAVAKRISFDPSSFQQLLDIREHKADQKQFDAAEMLGRYLAAIQQVTAAVDRMLDSTEARSS